MNRIDHLQANHLWNQQVREQSNRNAARIRQAVKQEKNKQLQKIASSLQVQILSIQKWIQLKIGHLSSGNISGGMTCNSTITQQNKETFIQQDSLWKSFLNIC